MVERGIIHPRSPLGIQRLHQINFNGEVTATQLANIFVDIFTLTDKVANLRNPQLPHPKFLQCVLVRTSDRYLLQP